MSKINTLVTGTNRGTGKAISQSLKSLGQVYWLNRTPPEQEEANGWICDFQDTVSLELICKKFSEGLEELNCLVLNSAHRVFKSFSEMTVQDFDTSYRVNVLANFIILKSFAKILIKNKGTVIILGSQAATNPCEHGAAYCTSKAALEMLGEVFFSEFRHAGVRTCVCHLGTIKNRPKENDDWKMDATEVANVIKSILVSDLENGGISRIEMRPLDIPLGEEAGPERLHRL